ncbi:hypothetical protein N7541_010588 [Penicillium brevicompactum]|uniref:Uncharacterized protein n=1 Tax=Penicillium brevicompactum TaxID=5074 RepID=A0A9W9UIC2_PENBR|nr:hypothetical protein N7541_010588 [Penicillium brevicompactum]
MKLSLVVTSLFAASATAAKYAAGQDCRTNKGCDQNCLGGKWSVAIVAGDARLVCDPSNLDSTRYARAYCERKDRTNEYDNTAIDKATKAACDSVKGKTCKGSCYLKTKASLEQDVTTKFQQKCSAAKGSSENDPNSDPGLPKDPHPYTGTALFYPSKDLAAPYGFCKPSDVFA